MTKSTRAVPEWGKVIPNTSGRGCTVIVFSPKQPVWTVCRKYFKQERGNIRWRTAVIFAAHEFMCANYQGPGDDKETAASLRQVHARASELMQSIAKLPTGVWEEPFVHSIEDGCFLDALSEVVENCKREIQLLDPRRGRGQPSREHARKFIRHLRDLYSHYRKPSSPKHPALFLKEFEGAFFDTEDVAIGVPIKDTKGHSEGARSIRGRAK